MNTNKYCIADTLFEVNFSKNFTSKVSLFSYTEKEEGQITSKIIIKSEVDYSIKDFPISRSHEGIFGEKTQDGYLVSLCDINGHVAHLINASHDWSSITVRTSMPQSLPFEGSVGEVAFRNSMLFHRGIVVHAAAIDYQGKGIIFSAPSGTGKSTQANLWKFHKGAEIINGDRPALRVIDNQCFVYGTPWSGTSMVFQNKKAPLAAIVMLEQSSTNSIKQLSLEEAVQLLVPRCFIPYYDEELITLSLNNIGDVITKTPCYLLKCRPDYEALELVEQCIKSKKT